MKIVFWPNPILKQKSVLVTEPPDPKFLDEMYVLMKSKAGVGLSAIQVGVAQQIVIIDVGSGRMEFINPLIVDKKDPQPKLEGCLSIPGQFDILRRYERVTVEYQDRNLQPQKLEASGVLSHALQHECEHLNGEIFVDRLSPAKRSEILGNMLKMKRSGKLK